MKKQLLSGVMFALSISTFTFSQQYPPQKQLVFDAMPSIDKPDFLEKIIDPTFKSTVIRISDQSEFNKTSNNLSIRHHYSKSQAWNSDGTLIKLHGWPSPILDGKTFKLLKTIRPPGGHTSWANTKPNIIYGAGSDNRIKMLDVNTNTQTTIATLEEFAHVSFGNYEGNLSNDDKYIALQCSSGTSKTMIVYDLENKKIQSRLNTTLWPNNISMSQSGKFVLIQWGVDGTTAEKGIWAYNTSDFSPVRNMFPSGGGHFDYGIDINGNEVVVGSNGNLSHPAARGLCMKNIVTGTTTLLISDAQMSYSIHVSCRNNKRPGYAYLSEFQASGTRTNVGNYQKVFAVKLDPNANNNALTESYVHVHHSNYENYEWETHASSNRDGSMVIFKSDWMGGGSAEVNSYVAYMQAPTSYEEATNNTLINVYPNPASGELFISHAPIGSEISISDMSGRVLLTEKTNQENTRINLQAFSKGIYLLKADKITQKLIIE
jgi:hypothetical protein